MTKKQSFLKRNPIIPSVFFILFAWGLLYLITGLKGANKSTPPQSLAPSIEFHLSNAPWQLDIDSQKIVFKADKNTEAQVFTNPALVFSASKENHHIEVFQSEKEAQKIHITLTRFRSGIAQVIVVYNGQYFYFYGK